MIYSNNYYYMFGVVNVLFFLFLNLLFRFVIKILGCFFYWIGEKKHYRFLKRKGHTMVAMSDPYSIWLIDKCPYYLGDKCKCWTCPAYDKYHRKFCVLENTDYPFLGDDFKSF